MPPPSRAQTVLVIDDDPGIRRLMTSFLKLEGFAPTTAANGKEALAYLREVGTVDVILLDLRMPVMDGWTFRREQRRDPAIADIPVVVLSGADAERAPELAAAAWFEKPVSVPKVISAIRLLCEHP
jgi:CheY-like chemotaxis protein